MLVVVKFLFTLTKWFEMLYFIKRQEHPKV